MSDIFRDGVSDVIQMLAAMPGLQLLFLVLAALTWLGGGNILVAYHYRRVGKPAWSGFKPFAFPFRHFNAKEWLGLAGLAALTFTFAGFASEAARCVRDDARDVLRVSYAVSAILPQHAPARRVAERSGARAAGQMEVWGLTWDRYVWPLATADEARLPETG